MSFIQKIQIALAKRHAQRVSFKSELNQIYHSNDVPKNKITISSSKLFLGFVLVDFLAIQIFSMWYMYTYPEYSDFGSFIGIAVGIIGQVGVILGYFKKSSVENTVGGIVYDAAMQQLNNNASDDEDCVG